MKLNIIHSFSVIVSLLIFEYFVGADVWWQHVLFIVVSLFVAGGLGAIGDAPSEYDGPQGTP